MRLVFTLLCALTVVAGCTTDQSIEGSTTTSISLTTSSTMSSEAIDSMLREKAAEVHVTMDAERIATLKSRLSESELVNGGFGGRIIGFAGSGPCYCRGIDENGRGITPCQCLWSTTFPIGNDS